MARPKRKARRGLPSPRSVVAEMPLIPGGTRPGRLAAAPGVAPTYRILRTTEVDPYDTPVPALSIPAIGAPAAAPAPPSDSFKGKARKATKLSIVAGHVAPAARGRERDVAVAGRDIEHLLAGADVEGLAQSFADNLQRGADNGVVAGGPGRLLAGLERDEVDGGVGGMYACSWLYS